MFLCHLLLLYSAYIPVGGTAIALFAPQVARTSNEGKVLLLGAQFTRVHLHTWFSREWTPKMGEHYRELTAPSSGSQKKYWHELSKKIIPYAEDAPPDEQKEREAIRAAGSAECRQTPRLVPPGLVLLRFWKQLRARMSNSWRNRGQNPINLDFLCRDWLATQPQKVL